MYNIREEITPDDYDALVYITDLDNWKVILKFADKMTQYVEGEIVRAPEDANLEILKGKQMGARMLMSMLRDLKESLKERE